MLADVAGKRLIIVDSNHNRVVIASYPDAMRPMPLVQQIIGTGATGSDGAFAAGHV